MTPKEEINLGARGSLSSCPITYCDPIFVLRILFANEYLLKPRHRRLFMLLEKIEIEFAHCPANRKLAKCLRRILCWNAMLLEIQQCWKMMLRLVGRAIVEHVGARLGTEGVREMTI